MRQVVVGIDYFLPVVDLSGEPLLKTITCIFASNKQDDGKPVWEPLGRAAAG